MQQIGPLVADVLAQYGEAARKRPEDIAYTKEQVPGSWFSDDRTD